MTDRGLYDKYNTPGGSFLLKPLRDKAARIALRAYAKATDDELLAVDLVKWMDRLDALTEDNRQHADIKERLDDIQREIQPELEAIHKAVRGPGFISDRP